MREENEVCRCRRCLNGASEGSGGARRDLECIIKKSLTRSLACSFVAQSDTMGSRTDGRGRKEGRKEGNGEGRATGRMHIAPLAPHKPRKKDPSDPLSEIETTAQHFGHNHNPSFPDRASGAVGVGAPFIEIGGTYFTLQRLAPERCKIGAWTYFTLQ